MSFEKARLIFIEESNDLLSQMEAQLLALEQGTAGPDAVSVLFRAVHTIKGSAGIFGYDTITNFAHSVEHLMSEWRDGKISATPPMLNLLMRCRDHIGRLVTLASGDTPPAEADLARSDELLLEISGAARGKTPPAATARADVPSQGAATPAVPEPAMSAWEVTFRPDQRVFTLGMDPMSPIRHLVKAGLVADVVVDTRAVPPLDVIDAEICHLGFTLHVNNAQREDITGAFEFFEGLGEITIEKIAAHEASDNADFQSGGAPARLEPVQATLPSAAAPDRGSTPPVSASRFLRVETTKLDELINLVGELVIAGANISQLAGKRTDPVMAEASAAMSRMIADLREQSLRVRMVKLGETFARFHRVVRDLGVETGKQIQLIIAGGDTELDKTVVEKILDPLMHLVRNAVDHGLETPEERLALGKAASGTITLNAYQETGTIVVEVRDDGRGFQVDKILETARRRKVIDPGTVLSPAEILKLVFQPGFSTASHVSTISGRGVGLDVVQQNIEALRGVVTLENNPGHGSLTRIRLPLTLAIIEGFMVRVGGSHYVVPMDMVLECVDAPEEVRQTGHGDFVNLRGDVLPFVRLGELFDESDSGRNIVVVQYADRKAGLLVDDLLGEYQTVIKPLGKLFANVRGIGGATILGNGSVALILDVPALINTAIQSDAARVAGETRA